MPERRPVTKIKPNVVKKEYDMTKVRNRLGRLVNMHHNELAGGGFLRVGADFLDDMIWLANQVKGGRKIDMPKETIAEDLDTDLLLDDDGNPIDLGEELEAVEA